MTNKNTTMRHTALTATVVSSALLLAACTGHKKDATQSAARVDGTEITVHQINYRLQRERGLRPEQQEEAEPQGARAADRRAADRREGREGQDGQGAGRAAGAATPRAARCWRAPTWSRRRRACRRPPTRRCTPYFDDNDALFAHRRVYTLQEYLAKVPEDKIPALRALVEGGKPPADVEAWFKAQGAPFRGQQSTHPAEQIPLNSLKALAAVQDGHGLVASAGNQVHVTYITSQHAGAGHVRQGQAGDRRSSSTVEARRKVTEANLAALKTSGKIEYSAAVRGAGGLGPGAGHDQGHRRRPADPRPPSGAHVTLPAANTSSGVQVTLPTTTTSSVQVTLPQTQGVHVSLPTTPASSVEVRLPAQAAPDAPKK